MGITNCREEAYPARALISQYLLNGSSADMNVDGSSVSVDFTYTIPANKNAFYASRLLLYYSGSTAFAPGEFANKGGALTNGVLLQADGYTIENWKDNVDVVTTFYDAEGYASLGNQARSIAGRWTFKDLCSMDRSLKLTSNITVTIRDDLSTLDFFRIKIQGTLQAG